MIKKFPTIISFYTQDTLYEDEVQNLIASCEKFQLETAIEGVPSFGSWELNCAYKPFFIMKKMQELQTPLLWVDADAVFLKEPEILEEFQSDFSVRINTELEEDHPSRVASGTVYINYTEPGIEIVLKWAEECRRQLTDPQRTEEFWDQIALRNVLSVSKGVISSLPIPYIKIFDHPKQCFLEPDPVIMHYQASRKFKNQTSEK